MPLPAAKARLSMGPRGNDRRPDLAHVPRQAAACGALCGAGAGTVIGIPSSLGAWLEAGSLAAVASFMAVWALWVVIGMLVCWIAAVVGGMRLRALLKWGAGIGAVCGLGMEAIYPLPLAPGTTMIVHAVGGIALAVIVSHVWWQYFAGR